MTKVEVMHPIAEWKETTCGKAKQMENKGITIWWRPTGRLNSKDPDNDLALYR